MMIAAFSFLALALALAVFVMRTPLFTWRQQRFAVVCVWSCAASWLVAIALLLAGAHAGDVPRGALATGALL